MTNNEINKNMMYIAIGNIFQKYAAAISQIPFFNEYYQHFQNLQQSLNLKNNIYLHIKKGTTADKENKKAELIEELLTKSNTLFLLARKNNNENLKAIARQSKSGLHKLRDFQLLNYADLLSKELQSNLESLKDFNMDAKVIEELNLKIKAFNISLNIKDTTQATGKASRKELKLLFKQIDDVLRHELDKSMELLRHTHKDFYQEYRAARIVKDLGQKTARIIKKNHDNLNEAMVTKTAKQK